MFYSQVKASDGRTAGRSVRKTETSGRILLWIRYKHITLAAWRQVFSWRPDGWAYSFYLHVGRNTDRGICVRLCVEAPVNILTFALCRRMNKAVSSCLFIFFNLIHPVRQASLIPAVCSNSFLSPDEQLVVIVIVVVATASSQRSQPERRPPSASLRELCSYLHSKYEHIHQYM